MKFYSKVLKSYLNKRGWYNLNASNKYRLVKENYFQTLAMINIQPLIDEVLNKHNDELFSNTPKTIFKSKKPKVFQYWHQGLDSLPEVVQNCYKTVDYFLGDEFEIVRIDYKTLFNYINLPIQILEAQNQERMTIAHLSDIVRNKLLLDYGGLWLDSTVLLTGKVDIFKFIDNKKVSFQNTLVFSNPKEHPVMVGSWMIWSSDANSKIFRLTQQVLEIYWKRNKTVSDYFLYHIIISDFLRKDKKLMEEVQWHKKSYSPNTLDLLFFTLERDYKDMEFLDLMKKTNIHKLDFKLMGSKQHDNHSFFKFFYNIQNFNSTVWRLIIQNQ